MKIIEKIKERKRLIVAFVVMLLFIMHSRPAAAVLWGGDGGDDGIIDKIVNAIGDFFHAIVNGFKDFFNAIVKAIVSPFEGLKNAFNDSYAWLYTHLGPLGVVAFVGVVGATAYVAIFWFKQNVEQIKNW